MLSIVIRQKKRAELQIPLDAILLLSVGELSQRKNHSVIVEALNRIDDKNVFYVIAGKGKQKDSLHQIDKTGRVKLIGYRSDIWELFCATDIFVLPSIQEGLPVALMEAMAHGLVCVASNIRGNNDLIDGVESGVLFDCKKVDSAIAALQAVANLNCLELSHSAQESINQFDQANINKKHMEEYKHIS